ncbi:MAG: right-handed parallel beta-helix repeat-containing protein [Bryobacteraceae bacterium]
MYKTTIILFGFSLGLLSTQSRATTYYLDSASGNDFRAGAQATAPWKSLQYASSKIYYPGDQILLKAGSVWNEPLEITTSDAEGDPIIIGSYGVGEQPMLTSSIVSSSPITLSSARNVVISNLKIQSSSRSLIVVKGGSNITVSHCTLINGATFPIHVIGSPGFKFLYNTYSNTSTFRVVGDVLRAESQVSGITVSGNHITLSGPSRSACGIYIMDVNNAVISGNIITGGSQAIGIKGYTHSVTGAQVYSNTVSGTDKSLGGDGESIEFTGVRRLGPWSVSGTIHNNVVKGGRYTMNGIAAYAGTNITAYSNTVSGPLQNSAFHWTTYSKNGVIHNNKVSGSVPNPFVVLSGSSAKMYSNTITR